MPIEVLPVPCLSDNYAYLVWRAGSGSALVVDPSEGEPVERALAEHGLVLAAILCTHHHWGHVGGNEALLARRAGLPVYAHRSDQEKARVPGQTHPVDDGHAFRVVGLE